jgi:4-hydroxyphenylpyruvate dioxygenase
MPATPPAKSRPRRSLFHTPQVPSWSVARGVKDDEITSLKRHSVLDDRDSAAEYFQIYTQALLEGGFFFEIVERRIYAGYGAVNAPIRLAVQTQPAPHPAMPRR